MDNDTADGWDDRTIGRQLRRIRNARGKSIRVIAGLAGISIGHLSEIENGRTALDRRSVIVGLANALQVSPNDLTSLPVPPPNGDGEADAAVCAVRSALLGVGVGAPGGQTMDVDVLAERVARLRATRRACRDDEVGRDLPNLIRDLHTTMARSHSARDDVILAELAVSLHVSGALSWLRDSGAPADLRWLPVSLAEQAAQRLDNPVPLGVAAFGTAVVLIAAGEFDLAGQCIPDPDSVPKSTEAGMRVAGMLSLTSSLLASTQGRDPDPSLDYAAELAERVGEEIDHHSYYSMSFGPANVEVWRLATLLERGDHDRAAGLGDVLQPEVIPSPKRRAAFLIDYGRALAHQRKRYNDAVIALRKAERLSPLRHHRSPFVRETLGELHARRSKLDDAIGRELRGMAYRAGLLPV